MMKILERCFLPQPRMSVHAASLAYFNGHMVFAWFGGSAEGANDVCIYLYNLHGDNKMIVIGNDNIPRWNPVLFTVADRLFLAEKAGLWCDRWQTFFHDITDWPRDITDKEIMATAQMLPAGLNGPVKTKPLLEFGTYSDGKSGVITFGSSVETAYDWSSWLEFYYLTKSNKLEFLNRQGPFFIAEKPVYTDFNGATRRGLGVIQPSLWHDDSGIHAFLRSSKPYGKIYLVDKFSGEYGYENITSPAPTNFRNPNSGIDTVYFNKKLYLAYNPSSSCRYPLVVSEIERTKERGLNFAVKEEVSIREKVTEEHAMFSPELSYPFMIEQGGKLHLVYTYGRRMIEYVVVGLE